MMKLFKNSYVVTYVAYFWGLILAAALFFVPILVALALNAGHSPGNSEGPYWGGLFAELVGFILLVMGACAFPPLSVYFFLQRQQQPAGKKTAILCLVFSPLLLIGLAAFVIPIVAHYIALHSQPNASPSDNSSPPSGPTPMPS